MIQKFYQTENTGLDRALTFATILFFVIFAIGIILGFTQRAIEWVFEALNKISPTLTIVTLVVGSLSLVAFTVIHTRNQIRGSKTRRGRFEEAVLGVIYLARALFIAAGSIILLMLAFS